MMGTLWHDWLHGLEIIEFPQPYGLLSFEESTPFQWLGGDADPLFTLHSSGLEGMLILCLHSIPVAWRGC